MIGWNPASGKSVSSTAQQSTTLLATNSIDSVSPHLWMAGVTVTAQPSSQGELAAPFTRLSQDIQACPAIVTVQAAILGLEESLAIL